MDGKEEKQRATSDALQQVKTITLKLKNKSQTVVNDAIHSEKTDQAIEAAKHAASTVAEVATDATARGWKTLKTATEETNENNWYLRTAKACEAVSDAVMGNPNGLSSKVTQGTAGKLGMVGTSAGIFSIASLLGTAGTGTAIGSLSGAAFTSASLAWIGGSVVAGTAILGVATIAGGVGAALGAKWASSKLVYGKKRELSELEQQEQKIVEASLALAIAFRKQTDAETPIDKVSAKYLYAEALVPLCEELAELQEDVDSWPYMARQRLTKAHSKLVDLSCTLKHWSIKNPNATIGIVSVVFLHLLAGDITNLSPNEALVLDALRRSNNDLTHASNEELATYVQGLNPAQIQGLQNNVKGIYHELRFANEENADGDQYFAEVFEATNHPGADVRITNIETGEIQDIQLKATDYISAIKEHNSRYETIDVFATTEVADQNAGISSSGFSNESLTEDVEATTERLDDYYDPNILESMGTAGLVALACNVRVILKGKSMSNDEKQNLVKDGAVSAGIAGLFSLIIG